MSSRDVSIGVTGVLIGMLAGGHMRPLVILSNLMVILSAGYISIIGIMRMSISECLASKRTRLSKEISYDLMGFPKDWIDENIDITYNVWYNRITVQRSFCTKLSTDSEYIERVIKQRMQSFLNWDILSHYRPLTIKFE